MRVAPPHAVTRLPAIAMSVLMSVGVLSLAACSSAGADDASAEQGPSVSEPAGDRPTLAPKTDTPRTDLQVTDIVVGDGAEAKAGDVVAVQYVGALWDGTEFDSSWERGEPFTFQLGVGGVIPGWDQGVTGMRVGGRRELVIPPDLAYGSEGTGPIPPDATLVFVVDLVGQASGDSGP